MKIQQNICTQNTSTRACLMISGKSITSRTASRHSEIRIQAHDHQGEEWVGVWLLADDLEGRPPAEGVISGVQAAEATGPMVGALLPQAFCCNSFCL